MRIGELARRGGTTTRALRYYESLGLLPARRGVNGQREYDEDDLRLVHEIRSLTGIGFALEDTRPFVQCLRDGHSTGDACAASVEVYRRKLAELDDCITRLGAVRDRVGAQLREAEQREAGQREAEQRSETCGR
ncbi:MerR family transcriptional regulator [Saccharothrix stipae]